ncbi:Hypothetical_protein [Hexamita inflata]|uniref:Hypothetical_protein n=1 Tax=Hexamita inflata TaxID=28002 RepID=A0AA86QFF4_9EUKA|nr:Hypothetical protein HINF_LOCUS38658 [Hexamita inflata]CAI9958319.1 Hypothetical protein HINF_LOCUS45964 [Hexamita inflata]
MQSIFEHVAEKSDLLLKSVSKYQNLDISLCPGAIQARLLTSRSEPRITQRLFCQQVSFKTPQILHQRLTQQQVDDLRMIDTSLFFAIPDQQRPVVSKELSVSPLDVGKIVKKMKRPAYSLQQLDILIPEKVKEQVIEEDQSEPAKGLVNQSSFFYIRKLNIPVIVSGYSKLIKSKVDFQKLIYMQKSPIKKPDRPKTQGIMHRKYFGTGNRYD